MVYITPSEVKVSIYQECGEERGKFCLLLVSLKRCEIWESRSHHLQFTVGNIQKYEANTDWKRCESGENKREKTENRGEQRRGRGYEREGEREASILSLYFSVK